METDEARAPSMPAHECDLVMEGGVTSGVVYPLALVELASQYRFRGIGGTSAGAIAAGLAAAAEHGREHGGFEKLRNLPEELATVLQGLFQPVPELKTVFEAFLANLGQQRSRGKKIADSVLGLISGYWIAALIGFLVSAVLFPWRGAWGLQTLFGIVVVGASVAIGVSIAVVMSVVKGLRTHDFGACPGMPQPGFSSPALTSWLTEKLDAFAGPRPEGSAQHLTFGDLEKKNIQLRMMTTNLSMHRPHSLPMAAASDGAHRFAFNEQEWRRLFPGSVVDQLIKGASSPRAGYFFLPAPEDLPVIVAVRMSLSFPILLSAVPLYAEDHSLRLATKDQKFRRCMFSDGGICNDFPIQFFDNLLPSRPTFAISLSEYDPLRNGPDPNKAEDRVFLPMEARSGIAEPIVRVDSIGEFAGAILTSARVWQFSMQSALSGYRERIVHVALSRKEGGLNLNMPRKIVEQLTRYGELAGKKFVNDFSFDEHRWRRLLVSFGCLYDALVDLHESYTSSYREFLKTYPDRAQSYEQTQQWLGELRACLDALDAVIAAQPPHLRTGGRIPRPRCRLRITPEP
jgi:predicted acylesterase/phospholipase RssA